MKKTFNHIFKHIFNHIFLFFLMLNISHIDITNIALAKTSSVETTSSDSSIPLQISIVPLENTTSYFTQNKKIHILSEYVVTNLDRKPIQINSITLSTTLKNKTLSKEGFNSDKIKSLFSLLGGDYLKDQNPALNVGESGIIFLESIVSYEKQIPDKLHSIFSITQNETNKTITIRPESISISKSKPITISSPVKGKNWVSVNGPSNKSLHRRIISTNNGKITIPEKYAVDWVKIDDKRDNLYKNNGQTNDDFFSYGQEVMAVADGKVVVVKNGIPDNDISNEKVSTEINQNNVSGNYISIKIGKDLYANYSHLREGTLRVKMNDKVHKGQVIGLLGNSGNSTAPHLHFQLSSSSDIFNSKAIAYQINKFIKHEYALDVTKKVKVISSNKITKESVVENEIIDF
ncbi:MAG: M23 family metallopeptidase [Oligoflexia bacterium]|nr:M23 family metallopeptidase [Oligoflexia bacterium]